MEIVACRYLCRVRRKNYNVIFYIKLIKKVKLNKGDGNKTQRSKR